ncbi:IS110 family transposase [Nocardia sp. NPDC059239]|uniref:IS110 family transposase n=1 Tax=Nocardia sp. NPDC059239 TaxID=3346785 RepID=UPI00369E3E8D
MLFIGDDWAEDHHDIEVMDPGGKILTRARLPEGAAGIAKLHSIIGERCGEDADNAEIVVGIETDRGLWVAALVAAGYTVYAVNPVRAARYRDRHSVSRAKSDAGDAHMLADMVRTDRHQLRQVAGDSTQVEAVKALSRAHKTLIWERTRHALRLRHTLLEYFPAALEAFDDLTAPEALLILDKAPCPTSAKKLTQTQIRAQLKRAGRCKLDTRTPILQAALRTEQLGQHATISAGYAVITRATVAVLTTLNEQIAALHDQVERFFTTHPDAEIVSSQPGIGVVLGARILGEFGDDPRRYASAKSRKNYAGTSPITRASGKKKIVAARFVHNDRLVDALTQQAFTAIRVSPGARAYYDRQRARGIEHYAALRHVANRLVGILHGCLKHRTPYNEATAWPTENGKITSAA